MGGHVTSILGRAICRAFWSWEPKDMAQSRSSQRLLNPQKMADLLAAKRLLVPRAKLLLRGGLLVPQVGEEAFAPLRTDHAPQ